MNGHGIKPKSMDGTVVLQGVDATARAVNLSAKKKVGRNEHCGKKLKRCCGADGVQPSLKH